MPPFITPTTYFDGKLYITSGYIPPDINLPQYDRNGWGEKKFNNLAKCDD
jgi:hypothetical protein